jgi:tight adherence protein B
MIEGLIDGLLILVFLSIAIAVFAIGAAMNRGPSHAEILRERLKSIEFATRRSHNPEVEVLRDELLSSIPAFNKLLARWSRSSRLQLLLDQADVKMRAGKFLLICACAGGIGFCLIDLFTRSTTLALAGLAIGLFLPWVHVLVTRRARFRKFEAMFPQAIELLVRSTRAGHPFTTALEMIGAELSEPIAGEFRRIFDEQKFGLPLRDALMNLAERVPLIDVKFLVTALLMQRETGGNLAEILDKLAYVIRERFRILRQVRVYTAQGRLTMIILLALPPGMVAFMSFTSPEFMRPLLTDPWGHVMIVAGVIMQFIGFLLIRRIIEIKV